jgi:formylglycine-generating enzyme required for sulfatase activity
MSSEAGIPEDQWCYLPNQDGKYGAGMRIAPDALQRTGYRLPTEAEWEYACRGEWPGPVPWGTLGELASTFAHTAIHPGPDKLTAVNLRRPNEFGMFDMCGNAAEWCHDRVDATPNSTSADNGDSGIVTDESVFVLRGGSAWDYPRLLRYVPREPLTAGQRRKYSGFRVSRTHPM